jgi:hypothetical protein
LVSIRIKKQIPDAAIIKANQLFKDFFNAGELKNSSPLPEEANEPEIQHLPRLVFKWGKKDFGTLRHLIDFINKNTV